MFYYLPHCQACKQADELLGCGSLALTKLKPASILNRIELSTSHSPQSKKNEHYIHCYYEEHEAAVVLKEFLMGILWGISITELVLQQRYATRPQAINDSTEYIEIFCTQQRRQKRLGFLPHRIFFEKNITEINWRRKKFGIHY